ncbi:hypothetical protein FRB95_014008 [Tulasnella sp. JGI-2019a]|nr:hypothetical protein FRB95_014008 [Tulasnella sp. JGI-2019a]
MEGFKFIRYDGKMGRNERDDTLKKFRTSSRYNVALVSLMAGSTGLNLTAANNVVLMDLWWNPALEDQAFNRAHRYGQKKEVFIYKLVIPGTIEERIQALQAQKRDLASNALTGHELGKKLGMSLEELLRLFDREHTQSVGSVVSASRPMIYLDIRKGSPVPFSRFLH